MGARLRFADVLLSKMADVPPPLVPGRPDARIASPGWVHRLEPLRVVPASLLHSRYPQPASAAPAAGGIPVGNAQAASRSGSRASVPPARRRTRRETLAIDILNRLGAGLAPTATDADVRSAYRRLLRASHPDMHPHAGVAERESHASRLRTAVGAWQMFHGRASGLGA